MTKINEGVFAGVEIDPIFSNEEKETVDYVLYKLRSDLQHVLHSVMVERKVSISQLASKLNKNISVISKQLDGGANLTLKTIAEMAHALGDRIRVSSTCYEDLIQQNKVASLYDVPEAPKQGAYNGPEKQYQGGLHPVGGSQNFGAMKLSAGSLPSFDPSMQGSMRSYQLGGATFK